jgi:hypothetical protein
VSAEERNEHYTITADHKGEQAIKELRVSKHLSQHSGLNAAAGTQECHHKHNLPYG